MCRRDLRLDGRPGHRPGGKGQAQGQGSRAGRPGPGAMTTELEPLSHHSRFSTPRLLRSAGLGVPGHQRYRKEAITYGKLYFLSQPAATPCCARPDTLGSRPQFNSNDDSDTNVTREAYGSYGCDRERNQTGQSLTKNFVVPGGLSRTSKRTPAADRW